jgi:hypothetical protein
MMRLKYSLGIFLMIVLIIAISQPGLAFNASQTLQYEGSYLLSTQKMNHTLTLDIDYFHELTDDVYLEGDLIIRTTNKQFGKPFVLAPNEIYVSAYNIIENLDLKAGKIINRWGAADIFSPLDNFNPAPPEISLTGQQSKIGAFGISATYYMGNSTYLYGAILPWLMPTPYPDEFLKSNYLSSYAAGMPEQGLDINQIGLNYQEAENIIWGLRLTHSFPTFDAGISYYRGNYMDPFPINLSISPDSKTEFTVGYPSKQVFGLEFQGEFPGIEGATLRGDLAYIVPEKWSFQGEDLLDNPYLKGVISADYTTDSNWYFNGGFIYGMPFEKGDDCSPYTYLNTKKEFDNSDFTPFYAAVLSLQDISMVNVIGVDYQLTESVSASLNYSFFLGDEHSKLSQFEQSQGIYLLLEWLF